jgi:60 kDa SS-A/Ro ribonucleoprotein
VTLKTYASGQGFRGGKTWNPVPGVVSALEDAFYLAFDAVEPTGKRYLFGIDVSGSMGSLINNTNVSCRSAAACMAMVSMRTEPRSYAFGFTDRFQDLGITAGDRLEEVERKVHHRNFGRTDCSVPMVHALSHRLEVDAFVVLTDNETYDGRTHPTVALESYRKKTGIDAKLIVVGMAVNDFSVADPADAGQMNVCGFDTAAPGIIANFVRGG